MTPSEIVQRVKEENPKALLAEGFDQAIVGYTQNSFPMVAVYDTEKCIAILTSSGMPLEQAVEYFEEDVLDKSYRSNQPIFISL